LGCNTSVAASNNFINDATGFNNVLAGFATKTNSFYSVSAITAACP